MLVTFDRAAIPFVLIAAVPAFVSVWMASGVVVLLWLLLPTAVALFFRDPDRVPVSGEGLVLAPADGTVMHAGPARPGEAPGGEWRQVTIFLSILDVHINRTPVGGRVTRVAYTPGTFRPAYRADASRNERSEIWIDHGGTTIVTRQVVGVLARRVVCRVKAGDELVAGDRIGLMKFGSRMDVFMPMSAMVAVAPGDRVVAGRTVIGRLAPKQER